MSELLEILLKEKADVDQKYLVANSLYMAAVEKHNKAQQKANYTLARYLDAVDRNLETDLLLEDLKEKRNELRLVYSSVIQLLEARQTLYKADVVRLEKAIANAKEIALNS